MTDASILKCLKLKACPFCGSSGFRVFVQNPWFGVFGYNRVICKGCGAEGPDGCQSAEQAMETWNVRDRKDDENS